MSPRRRELALLALSRATSGLLAKAALAVGGVTLLGCFALAAAARRSASLPRVPVAAAWLLAWGAGVLLAFSAAARALERDRDDGTLDLVRARGHGRGAWTAARIGGLGAALLAVSGGGALATGAACALVAPSAKLALASLQGALAAFVYSACFSAIVAPVAFAALGARSRAGGYFWLLVVLVVPAAISGLTAPLAPAGWEPLVSVPGVLDAARAALAPPGVDPVGLARALAVAVGIAAVAFAVARAEAARASDEP